MKAKMPLAITWFAHRRTDSLCQKLGWTYLVIDTHSRGLIRYVELSFRTIVSLVRRRPRVVVAQNPSLVLTLLCIALRPALRFRLVVDAHNEAIRPYLHTGIFIVWATRVCHQCADLTIVTNRPLAETVIRAGGKAYVLPDPIPRSPEVSVTPSREGGFLIAVISTFARDEPLSEVFGAASLLPGTFHFRVTGNVKHLEPALRAKAPENVIFTGFLSEADYWGLLFECDAVVDLTKMPDCLVCGAYEAVGARKPLVLSDSRVARDWFGDAATYVDNVATAIAESVLRIHAESATWRRRSELANTRIQSSWEKLGDELRVAIRTLER
jgi:glycosyltransferase involved in cell wall biosynthesis